MEDKSPKRFGLAAMALAALAAPVVTNEAAAAGTGSPAHNDTLADAQGRQGIVLGRDGKPMNNNFVDRADKPPQNNNAIVLGKYRDKQHPNTIIIVGGSGQ